MTNEPEGQEKLAENGLHSFDVTFLDRPGGVEIQPSRNDDANDTFDPLDPLQDDPADFVAPSVMIWDEGTSSLIAAPAGYNPPVVSNLRYAGTKGRFLVDLTGQDTRLSSDLVNEKWAIVWDTQVNGNDFRAHEFFTVLSDGDAAFGEDERLYADATVVARRSQVSFSDLGLADQAAMDDLIESLNARASEVIEERTGRDFILHSNDIARLDGSDLDSMLLPGYPVVEVVSVTEDGTTMDSADWRLKPATPKPGHSPGILQRKPPFLFRRLPNQWERYVVTYTWGFNQVPRAVKHVAENLVVRMLALAKQQQTTGGASTISMEGYSVTYGVEFASALLTDDDKRTLDRFKRIWVA